MTKALTHYEYQANVLLPTFIVGTRALTTFMTGQKAWDIIQEVNDTNIFKGFAPRTGTFVKENSNFIYWARVYVRQTYGEEVHRELDEMFRSMGYHRLKEKAH